MKDKEIKSKVLDEVDKVILNGRADPTEEAIKITKRIVIEQERKKWAEEKELLLKHNSIAVDANKRYHGYIVNFRKEKQELERQINDLSMKDHTADDTAIEAYKKELIKKIDKELLDPNNRCLDGIEVFQWVRNWITGKE